MIKNIVFDMGNVLIRYDARYYAEKYAPDRADQELLLRELFSSVEWVRMDRGSITEEEAIRAVCGRVPERLHGSVRAAFEGWHLDIPPVPGVEELAGELKTAGYPIYLLSNTSVRFHEFRERISALRWFDGEFVSADWRMVKPNEEIYRAFCQHFSLVPAECFFIDDSPVNIEGAQRMGMDGFVFHGDVRALRAALRRAGVSCREAAGRV